jgi:Flp pilus assembly protein TadG
MRPSRKLGHFALGRFGRARDGAAAVEFAFLLPVMLVMFFGVVEVSRALSCRADVINVASTAADLTAQASSLSTSDVSNVFSAASAILYPYDTSTARIIITSIVYNTTSKSLTSGNVAWSCANTGSPHGSGSIALPAGLMTENGSVIMAEITYTYTSPTTKVITGPMTMTNTFYTKPRRVAQIPAPTCP